MTKIKICGLTNPTEIEIINQVHPDLAGFVFAGGRHQVTSKQAQQLRIQLDSQIKAVGVFVDTPIDEIIQLANDGVIQVAQLHGDQTEDDVQALQNAGIPVIRVFKPSRQSVTTTNADYVMVDSGNGSGQPLDWQSLQIQVKQPIILAGGLNPNNAQRAIDTVAPDYLDVSSGVEAAGKKSYELVNKMVTIAHSN
ncbi:phosphoribosylanthranilate isomerase (plasmid) [Nicoliella spurrieriana]|uniref:N-(5'-phosphoribosyl)anthranilate isomerase n=1 Tax=Nicoliella spurrieriana TaxID=2925830 RepID=A0A976RQL1_9LACO|nr:phosphoribosylanthranilate isomerase [Nicoliella spurrieriana]UQS86006.1 phosphoribosylanthranilate isomerase [Nicoliella spurrieriana]